MECPSWPDGGEPHDPMETIGQKHQKLGRGCGRSSNWRGSLATLEAPQEEEAAKEDERTCL